MNTNEVAKLLGVSQSTIQRWVKQLDLPMEKNDRGHYIFSPEDIELIKSIQIQIQNGTLLQDIPPLHAKKERKGIIKMKDNNHLAELTSKVSLLEKKIDGKADSVAAYQLLQHRREIEDLQSQVLTLLKRVETLEMQNISIQPNENSFINDQPRANKKEKKKNIVSSLFSFL